MSPIRVSGFTLRWQLWRLVDSCYFGGLYQGYTPENDYEDSQIASFQWIFTLIGGGPSPFPSSNEIHLRDGPTEG